jgi:hypothetical protein
MEDEYFEVQLAEYGISSAANQGVIDFNYANSWRAKRRCQFDEPFLKEIVASFLLITPSSVVMDLKHVVKPQL